jgi:hypothetical protein
MTRLQIKSPYTAGDETHWINQGIFRPLAGLFVAESPSLRWPMVSASKNSRSTIAWMFVFALFISSAASVALGGSISGIVISDPEGTPIQNIHIKVYDSNKSYIKETTTNSTGNYSIDLLDAGTYYLEAAESIFYFGECYNNSANLNTATPITVTVGNDTSAINFILVHAGSIAGRITRESDNTGVSGVYVEGYDSAKNWRKRAQTDSEGYYSLGPLSSGIHYVSAQNSQDSLGEYYNDAATISAATPIPVTLGDVTTGIDMALAKGGSISGKVMRDSDGAPLPNVDLAAHDSNGGSAVYGTTDSQGVYSIMPLRSGLYYVWAYDSSPYLGEYYRNASSVGSATPVTVVLGADTPNIDLSLARGSSISGKVTRTSDGAALYNARVYLFDRDWHFLGDRYTNSLGDYWFSPLEAGTYRVRSKYITQTISLPAATSLTNIDFAINTTGEGELSGKVAGTFDGAPIQNAVVWVYTSNVGTYNSNWRQYISTSTDSEGKYTFTGLPADSYLVSVSSGSALEYYDSALTVAAATPVAVPPSQATLGINFAVGIKYALSVGVSGNGSVTSSPTGIDCASQCSHRFASGLSVTLTPEPTEGQLFVGWGGACSGTGSCVVALTSDRSVTANFIPTRGKKDFDADGKVDITVWRPGTGTWYVLASGTPGTYSAIQWGLPSDVPVSGDYDADAKTDIAVWRPETGIWYVLPSNMPGTYSSTQWGLPSDLPVPGDYDGDGRADLAVWRPDTGIWYILPSGAPGTYTAIQWGVEADTPVPQDYDGDGKTDVAVWRPVSGTWFIKPSSLPGSYTATQWGVSTDIPVPGDYDGDGKTDPAVWRPGTGIWYSLSSRVPGSYKSTQWGVSSDIPTPGDYDGDGTTDFAVWRSDSGIWYVLHNGSPGVYCGTQWGMPGDQPESSASQILRVISQ